MQQLLSETLEWRTDKELENLSSDEADLDIRAPLSWSYWVNAFANLFSPVNRFVLLPRTIANLKQAAGESVDTYGLRVTQAYARLLAEAKRAAPTNVSHYKHAWQASVSYTPGLGLCRGRFEGGTRDVEHRNCMCILPRPEKVEN